MTLHVVDHILVALIVVLFPVFDYFSMRREAARIHAGQTERRQALYRKIVIEEWTSAAVVAALWFLLERGAAPLGLVPRFGPVALAGYGLSALVCAGLILQARAVIGNPATHERVRGQFGKLDFITPHSDAELRRFYAVSLTAGVCEELVYRGFVTAYAMALLDVPFWIGALVSSLAFGLAHAYQGPVGVLRTAAVGGLMAVLYGLTGSLWAPIVAHAVMDATSGRISHAVFGGSA